MNTLDIAVQTAARQLLNLKMSSIVGMADEDDAANLRSDLESVTAVFKELLAVFGEVAAENFNGIDKEDFTPAWVDDAIYSLTQAAEEITEARQWAAE